MSQLATPPRSPLRWISATYAAKVSEHAQSLPAPCLEDAPAEADARRMQRMVEQLVEMPSKTRQELFQLLRWKARAVPWSAIHPSWILPLFDALPGGWRLWAVASLPPEIRGQFARADGETVILSPGKPPPWWIGWIADHVRESLDYPEFAPWERGGEDALRSLWEHEQAELERLLRAHGATGLVACIRKMPRPEAQQLLWQVPADLEPLVADTVQSQKWVDDPFWTTILAEFEALSPDVGGRLFWMGFADVLRYGNQSDASAHLRRLAFRLPREAGHWALEQLRSRPAWLALPLQPSVEHWKERFQALRDELLGRAQPPMTSKARTET